MLFFKEQKKEETNSNSIVSNHHPLLLCAKRNDAKNENRRGRIDDQESQSGHAHAHQGTFFLPTLLLLLPLSLSLSRRAINAQNQSCCGSMMRSIVIGDAFFFSLSRSRVLFSLSPRDETNVFAKRTTGSRGKRER